MTTLVHHDQDMLGKNKDAIDHLRTMAVELPPDDMIEAFDIITAQNSVFYWSDHPELALLNIWKMLKPGGTLLATIPPRQREINGENVDIRTVISSSELFNYEEIGGNDKAIFVRLTK
jgi:SAM-dependent methyltransferase